MKIVPIQLQIPSLNSHGAVVGSHPVPFYLITPTGKTNDGRGLAYALSHEDAIDICRAFDLGPQLQILRQEAKRILEQSADAEHLDTRDCLALLQNLASPLTRP